MKEPETQVESLEDFVLSQNQKILNLLVLHRDLVERDFRNSLIRDMQLLVLVLIVAVVAIRALVR